MKVINLMSVALFVCFSVAFECDLAANASEL